MDIKTRKTTSQTEVFKNPVQEQQNIRWVIVVMLFSYLLIHDFIVGQLDSYADSSVFLIVILFSILTVTIQIMIRSTVNDSITKAVAIAVDTGLLSIFLLYGQEKTAFFYPLYLWVIIGNGTRYGIKHLVMAAGTSMIGFGIVVLSTPYWQANIQLSIGLLIGLAVVPLYLSKLLTRLNHALDEAVKANQAKSQFLANISHELRTPLNGIIASADLLQEESLSESGKKKVSMIADAAQSQMALISEVLDFSKAEAGKMQESQQVATLETIIQHVNNIMLPQAETKGIDYQVDIQGEMKQQARLYPQAMQQVLINLVGNAIKFTPQGSVKLQTRSLLDKDGNNLWRFEVTDTGIGISQSVLETIFDPFVQADESVTRKFGGTGLGTAISKELVEMMDGQIGCDSTPDVGSCFWFEIPVQTIDNQDLVSSESVDSANVLNTGSKRVKVTPPLEVLVADDNQTNRDVLEMILVREGHSVTLVNDGLQALEALQNYQKYDLVILDRNMPELDGLTVMQMFKENTSGLPGKQPKFMLITADDTEATRELALQSGVDSFMTKPVRPHGIQAAIDALFIIVGERTKEKSEIIINSALRLAVDNTSDQVITTVNVEQSEILDQSKLEELEELSSGLSGQMIAGFIDDGDRLIQALTEACNISDFPQIQDIAHAIKGSALQLGAVRLAEYCKSLKMLKRSQLDQKADTINKEMKYLYTEVRNCLLAYHQEERKVQIS